LSSFATTQAAYEKNYFVLFEAMDKVESILSKSRYLTGDRLTLADIRLWTTLVRFDPVYYGTLRISFDVLKILITCVGHFKTNKKRLIDYPNLWRFTREIYQILEVKRTVNMEHIKKHYYGSHKTINPTGVVPVGPEIDFDAPVQQH